MAEATYSESLASNPELQGRFIIDAQYLAAFIVKYDWHSR